jgi:hypothetical protein
MAPVVSGAISPQDTQPVDPVSGSFPVIDNITCTLANTEYSLTLTTNTRKFNITTRQGNELKLSFIASQSGTVYRTIPAGAEYSELFIGDSSLTLYFQSPKSDTIVEVIHWY